MIALNPERSRNFCLPYEVANHLLTDEERGFIVTIYYSTQILKSTGLPEGKQDLLDSLVRKHFLKVTETGYELIY